MIRLRLSILLKYNLSKKQSLLWYFTSSGYPYNEKYFSDIYVCKMEEDIRISAKPILYKRYVVDTYVLRKKHETDKNSF